MIIKGMERRIYMYTNLVWSIIYSSGFYINLNYLNWDSSSEKYLFKPAQNVRILYLFKHAKNVRIHIILHMRKVSSGPLLSSHTFCSIQ